MQGDPIHNKEKIMGFQTISGIFVAHKSFGTANEFTLRQPNGPVQVLCDTAIPPMREDDMIVVILWGGKVIAITNLATGTEFHYRTTAPAGPYRRKEITATHLLLLAIVLGAFGYFAFTAGAFSQMKYIHDGEGAMLLLGVICYLILMTWIFRSSIVDWHNARVDRQVQDRIRAACVDSSLWDIETEGSN
jgi:hypothetical protein